MTDAEQPEELEPIAFEAGAESDTADADAADMEAATPRRKRKWMRRMGWSGGITTLLLVALLVVGFFWVSSAGFEELVRLRVVKALEDATGGRVEIASFHWNLLDLRAEAKGITIHGLEAANEAPYAHVDRLRVQVAIPGLLHDLFTAGASPRVILREAEIQRPEFHLIVYSDGTTNQPHPKKAPKPGKPVMDTLFQAQIGKLAVEQGTAHIANYVVPLDLHAEDANLMLSWVPDSGPAIGASAKDWGSYRIEVGLGQLAFARGKFQPVTSRLDASLLLLHDGARLDSLRVQAMDGKMVHALTVRGSVANFAHPVWQAQAEGQMDLRLLGPLTGFVNAHSGGGSLNASAKGHGADFVAQGRITSDAIHYQDAVVDAQTGDFSANFRADTRKLEVSDIRVKISRGGQLNGAFQYENWLNNTPKPAVQAALLREKKTWPVPTGTVQATLNGITLDTVLVMMAAPQYRHLGLDTVVSGPATASWTGLAQDLQIGGQFGMTPSSAPVPGEAPLTGSVDAVYHVDSGSVKVRTLDLRLPHSSVAGKGSLGVYPINRASEMDIDLQSSDLSEFDAVLRTLSLKHGNRIGTAALPVQLRGKAQFHGQLNSSWLVPRVEGRVTATDIGIEIPTSSTDPNAPLTYSHWDSVDVDGLYSPAKVEIHHGVLHRGAASLTLEGYLDADDPAYTLQDTEPEFDAGSVMALKATAKDFPLTDLLPLAGVTDPISGKLNANVDVKGQIKALTGSGTVDVAEAKAYGESVDHVHVVGSVAGQQVKIASLTVKQGGGAGQLTASGSYDMAHKSFQVDARGSAIDLASIQAVRKAGLGVTGKLGLTLTGEGTLEDPRIQANATFSSMKVGEEPVADLLVSAASRERSVTYDLSSHQPAGELSAHGVTALNADYTTQASLQFSKFDIGALLKLMKVTGITGQSDLEGTGKLSGPLAHPEKLAGEADVRELAVVVQGVHLASKGPLHATLSNGVARLDPLEVTGEDTDLKLSGTLGVTGKQQLDLEASGSINMRLAESLDPDLIASGVTKFQMQAHGPVGNPILQGKVEFQNASIALQDFPNGLSQIKGMLEFSQNRLEVRSLTAMSGGGQLSVAGYIGFQHGLYADLSATGKSIRIRYPQGISSLADANLKLQGPQNNLLLSGNVLVTRFSINSDLDISAFAAQSGVRPVVSPDAPSNHLRLDVHLTSAPQLNFQNAFAKLAGDVDLHLRGTLAAPSILGRISLTEGNTSLGGTKYELERGDIYFNNPVRIEPNIDLDATARVEDYDITLGLHGTPDKLHISYRSEPPLPEADVLALLALGRTQDEQRVNSQQQQQAGDNPMTDALLGGALNATVSNRVQRLFGSGSIKLDPNFLGSIGNSTARVTVIEQIGKNLTFTYASNVNTTSQQLIQAEIAVNRHVSLLVTQDESGIFSMVVKTRRRFK